MIYYAIAPAVVIHQNTLYQSQIIRIARPPMVFICRHHACLAMVLRPLCSEIRGWHGTANLQTNMVLKCGCALCYLMRFSPQSPQRAKSW